MNTKTIKVVFKKWLGIESAEIEFDRPLSIIQGDNATGKTSVKDGIDYALGALVRGIARNKNKVLGLDGEKFSIQMDLYGDKFKASKSNTPTQDDVADAIKVSRSAMPYVTDPTLFLRATQPKLKALLSEVLQLDFDWKAEAIKRGCDPAKVKSLPDGIKDALKAAEKTRAALGGEQGDDGVGRTVNRAKTRSPIPPEDSMVVLSKGETKASQVDLDDLGAGLKALYEEKDALTQKKAKIKVLTEEDVTRIGEEIEKWSDQLKDAPDETILRPRLAEIKHERDVSTRKQAEAKARKDSIVQEREKWDRVLKLKLCAKCRKLVEHELLMKDGHTQAIDENEEDYSAKIEKLTGEIVRIDQKLVRPGGATIMVKINELQKQLDDAGDAGEAAKIDAEIDQLKERIEIGQIARDMVRDYDTAQKAYKDACEAFEDDKAEWDLWDTVCKEIPAIQGMAIGDGLTPFRKIIEDQNILDGDIQLEDDLSITYNGRSFSMASRSEQYIIALAPYFATVELFGFPFCQIDNGDSIVSDELKGRLFEVVSKMSDSKQVIFYQAKSANRKPEDIEAEIEMAKDAGIGLYQTADRTVTRIA